MTTNEIDNAIRVTAHYHAAFDIGMVERQLEAMTTKRGDRREIASCIARLVADGEIRHTAQGWAANSKEAAK